MTKLLTNNGGKSSLYITQKRFSYNIENEITSPGEFSDLSKDVKPVLHAQEINSQNSKKYPILVRVTDGNKSKSSKVKLSTIVEPAQLDAFWNEYTNVLKAGFVGLKKKSKKKSKKASKSAK